MAEIMIDSFQDVVKIVPILFLVILFTNWLTGKVNKGTENFSRLARLDVVGGALLGIIPQCGISVALAKLYSNGYITLGMLMAVFLAGSDEALIVIGAHPDKLFLILIIIGSKVPLAVAAGLLINLTIKERRNRLKGCGIDCDCPKCGKYKNILVNSLVHTLKLTLFLYVTVLIIEIGADHFGEEGLYVLLGGNTFLQPVVASLIGMIPSCFSSVLIAEGFLQGALGFGSMMAGLLANTGFGILVLFKELPLKKTLGIILLLQAISILVGEVLHFAVG
ncbi:putative manganese transporter [Desulfosporosinus sp. PR]|uniref:putative manganese transporter n=1 Tax=Candidatus Desulfosporosinus nitrosoreducens TaxID=3401928 RepID=UPI0027F60F03|nr:putative manganese transporter [Desulfosporosinus sp. PR]MDQ7097189.1 putative manganese transporter [Desulfosporosinus sp. PR]